MITPEGYWEIASVFNRLGESRYGDAWTGAELNARQLPSPDEISAKRQEEAEDYEEAKHAHGVEAFMQQASGKPPGHLVEINPFADDSLPDPDDKKYLAEREARQRRDEIEPRLIERLYSGTIPVYLKDQHGEIHDLPSRLWQSAEFRYFLGSSWAEWRADKQTTYTGSLLVKITDAWQLLAEDSTPRQGKVVPLRPVGRRSSDWAEVKQEMRRRHTEGEMLSSLYQEAKVLAKWAKTNVAKPPKESTIKNDPHIKRIYRELQKPPPAED